VRIQTRGLDGLPVGESPLWSVREVTASADSVAAVLPAWSAFSDVDLTAPGLGFEAARNALVPSGDPWQARQAAMARYSRTGFEAAAVSAIGIALAMRVPGKRREVVLRFGHPYAVVAITSDPTAAASPWNGLPVFSAWVSEPENATDDASPDDASTDVKP
jgi:hypothetical protein